MSSEIRAKIYIIETNIVIQSSMAEVMGKKGVRNEPHLPQVIENKYRKNVCFSALHHVDENTGVKAFSP